LLNLTGYNPPSDGLVAREHRFPEGFNVTGACHDRGKGTSRENNPVQALWMRASTVAARGSRLLENGMMRRPRLPGGRRRVVAHYWRPWIISPSNSSTASCSARSMG
jgi:hypothetical protein